MAKTLPVAVLTILCVVSYGSAQSTTRPFRSTDRNQVSIAERDGYRYITSNGIPDHTTGRFPNRNNPNRISAQRHTYRVPLNPKANEEPTPLRMHPFGVAVNGVPFDPGAAEFWQRNPRSGWQYEALDGRINLGLDTSNAHVQPTGAYHYHGLPTGLIARLTKGSKKMTLVGWAADGFPIYARYGEVTGGSRKSQLVELRSSYRVKQGSRPRGTGPGGKHDGTFVQDWEYVKGAGDLDEFNGYFGPTPENPEGEYYYVITNEFPYIPRQLRGTPDASFQRHGPPGGRPPFGPPPRGGRPPFPPPRR